MIPLLAALLFVPTPLSDAPPGSGARTLNQWVLLLGSSNNRLADEAWKQVRAAGSAAVPALSAELQATENPTFVRLAALCLYHVGREAQGAAPTLESLIERWPGERRTLVLALAGVDPEWARPFARDLAGCTRSPLAWERTLCIEAAGDVGGEEVFSALREALENRDPTTRVVAVRALGKAPRAEARAALETRLQDAEPEVRLTAAAALLEQSDSQGPPDILSSIANAVCQGRRSDVGIVARTLSRSRRAAEAAEGTLVQLIRGADPECRMRAAVVLGVIDPNRARPALPFLREALRTDDDSLRAWAVRGVEGMGVGAREAVSDLDELMRTAPDLRNKVESALLRIQNGALPYRLFDGLRLVGTAPRTPPVAYLTVRGGTELFLFEANPGQDCVDGTIDRIEPQAIHFTGEKVSRDLSTEPVDAELRLFEGRQPDERPFGKAYTGGLMSVDFQGDIATFASLMARVSGLGVVLEAGTKGPVQVVAADAPWDGIFERGLESGGFVYRLDHDVLRIARPEICDQMRMIGERTWSEHPISFDMTGVRMDELMTLFEDISGLKIDYPAGPHEPVVVFLAETPWDKIFDLVLASRHWTHRREGDRIHVEPAGGTRATVD